MRSAIALLLVLASTAAQAQSAADLQALGQQYAGQYGVPWAIFQAQIQGESGWNPNIGCNAAGACGIGQFVPGTAAQFGIDPSNATQSLQAAAQYDAQLYASHGNSWAAALTAYTGGCTPANPCNASYAQAFAQAQAVDSGTANGATGLTPEQLAALGQAQPTPGGGGAVFATPGTNAVVAPWNGFTWLWQQY